jgi:hypothetical protein
LWAAWSILMTSARTCSLSCRSPKRCLASSLVRD